MTDKSSNVSDSIDSLSVAAEFLLCAIRALAHGAPPDSQAVMDPVKWAQAKVDEGLSLLKSPD